MASANGTVGEATVGTPTSAASKYFSSLFASQNEFADLQRGEVDVKASEFGGEIVNGDKAAPFDLVCEPVKLRKLLGNQATRVIG